MTRGFIVVCVPPDCSLENIIYSKKKGKFSCSGHQGPLTHSFIPADNLDLTDGKGSFESVIEGYSKELSNLRGQIDGLLARNTVLEADAGTSQRDIDALKARIADLETQNESLRSQCGKDKWIVWKRKDDSSRAEECSAKLSETESMLAKSRTSNLNLNKKLEEATSNLDARSLENKVLKERVQELTTKNEESMKVQKHLQMELVDLKDVLARKIDRISDLESTNKHLRNEQAGLKKTDTRAIVEAFLQYFTDVMNSAEDKSELEELRTAIEIRSGQLVMNLKGLGLTLSYHDRGDELGDGRMEILAVSTDDPELDGRIKRTERLGCRFGSDYITDLPESVTVYRYEQKEAE